MKIQFTIITKPHKAGKGYIIMEIMSTNVTINTRCRGENWRKAIYFGVGLREVYIRFQKKIDEKLR